MISLPPKPRYAALYPAAPYVLIAFAGASAILAFRSRHPWFNWTLDLFVLVVNVLVLVLYYRKLKPFWDKCDAWNKGQWHA